MKVFGVNLQITIPQAKLVGKRSVLFAIRRVGLRCFNFLPVGVFSEGSDKMGIILFNAILFSVCDTMTCQIFFYMVATAPSANEK